ncbi:MAG: hypothetical protein U1G07_22135 [Verrucomicrobiota bacterium]
MIKFVVRWAFRFLVLALLLIVAVILLKDILAKSLLEQRIRTQTGMEVKIGKLELGLLSPTITLDDLKLYNPPEFGGSPFLVIPDLHLVYYRGALARQRLHLKLLRAVVTEINVVEAKDGRTNLVLSLDDWSPAGTGHQARPPEHILGYAFGGIDVLNLTLGKLTYSSLRHPGKSTAAEIGLKNEVILGVQSISDLQRILMKALFRNGITIYTSDPDAAKPRAVTRPLQRPKGR